MQLKLTSAAKSRSARKPRNAFSKAEAAAPEAAAPEAEAAAAIASSGIAALAPLDSSVAPAIVPEAESATSEAPAAPEAEADALATRNERRILAAAIFHRLADNVSVPIKPLADFAYKRAIGVLRCKTASERQAAAILVCLTASGLPLSDGTTAPRKFTLRGKNYAIENGCLADSVSVGLISYDSAAESITLRVGAEKRCRELLGNLIAEFAI